jgi:hypothetical protein
MIHLYVSYNLSLASLTEHDVNLAVYFCQATRLWKKSFGFSLVFRTRSVKWNQHCKAATILCHQMSNRRRIALIAI